MSSSPNTPFTGPAGREDGGVPGAPGREDGGVSGAAGSGSAAVFCADPEDLSAVSGAGVPEGFAGRLSLGSVELLGFEETIGALERLGVLICWAQAQQARVAARLEELFARDIARAAGREDPGLALSLAAAEAGAVLNLPHMSAMRLVSESSRLGRDHPQTLARLEEGRIGYQHARIILDETQHIPDVPGTPGTVDPVCNAGAGSAEDPGATDLGDAAKDPDGTEPGDTGTGLGDSGGVGQPTLLDLLGSEGGGPDAAVCPDAAGEPVNMRQRFEADLLGKAEGRTAAGFGKRARRLRESRFPDTVPVRHREALERRRVCFEALPDGMSCLTAFLAAEQGQAIYAALSGAAKAGKVAGDPRTVDQLRADVLAAVLLDGNHPDATYDPDCREMPNFSAHQRVPLQPECRPAGPEGVGRRRTGRASAPRGPERDRSPAAGSVGQTSAVPDPAESSPIGQAHPSGPSSPARPANPTDPANPSNPADPPIPTDPANPSNPADPAGPATPDTGTGPGGRADSPVWPGAGLLQPGARKPRDDDSPQLLSAPGRHARRAERHRERTRVKTEVMVLINADTLAGLNDSPAELNGYGPISAEAGRRMILQALSWTPLLQDPASGEILGVGRRRRIPAGLKRWLQARDGTCRFPGCAVNVSRSEIDHTMPWAHGGPTEHSNLEHLCPKHHRFKTLGHWKARQPEPGLIEWTSPAGRTYRTNPALDHQNKDSAPGEGAWRSALWTSPVDEATRPAPKDAPAPF